MSSMSPNGFFELGLRFILVWLTIAAISGRHGVDLLAIPQNQPGAFT